MIELHDTESIVRLVRSEMRKKGWTFKELWERASKHGSISYTTVCNLASGETIYPRFNTAFLVLKALGVRITASTTLGQPASARLAAVAGRAAPARALVSSPRGAAARSAALPG